jgi:hypothetical protein
MPQSRQTRARPGPNRVTRFLCRLGLGFSLLVALGCGDDQSAQGDVVCNGTECQCPGTGDCEVDCQSDCDLMCTGSGNCDFTCGAGCEASCPGSGACLLDVGDESSVICTGSGGCEVTCRGDCTVECPGSGVCITRCDEGFNCEITRCEDVVSCPGGVQVCNGACPP